MSEQTADVGTPLPYAREWPARHDLDAARVIVYSFVVLLSVVALAKYRNACSPVAPPSGWEGLAVWGRGGRYLRGNFL